MNTLDKIYRLAVTLCLFYFVLKFISLTVEKNESYRLTKKYIDFFQNNRKFLIEKSNQKIFFLKTQNELTAQKVYRQKKIIDSLEQVKSKIKVIFIEKSKKINDFNAKQLENYFKNEIK